MTVVEWRRGHRAATYRRSFGDRFIGDEGVQRLGGDASGEEDAFERR
ncbi:MAG TPA: hypothetical protein VNR64_19095 [Vicinamibacterales bacterium]|nr:hypothetical protein [Vicinamibacterales bacterium]